VQRREDDRRIDAQHTGAEHTDVDVHANEGALSFFMHDRVSWGSIWGGFLTAMGTFILLSLLATAIGLTTIDAGQADPDTLNRWAGVISAIIGLVAFFIGGYVAGLMGGFVAPLAGMMNGFLVWALANVVMLALAAFGLGQLFGAAGSLYDQFAGASVQLNIDQSVVNGLQTSAWIAFIAMALAAFAAAAGGWLGTISRGPAPAADDFD
jgi:hypothetical protein